METRVVFDIAQIQSILPHRPPFLLIDRVVELVDNERCVALKNVTVNEPFFVGHFPGRPVMPGVLVLEAMAQTGAVLAIKSQDGVLPGKYIFLTGVTDVRWKRPVVPGDTLRIELVSVRKRRPLWVMAATATVDGVVVCQATISAAEVP